ncbi:MAG: CYTH domain-containing protein, partial [archaeon]|nr:CYTH domain-containing protein [archaeon]
MGKEIERKYKVDQKNLPDLSCTQKSEIEQYYFNDSDLADILKETYDILKGITEINDIKDINNKYSARIRKKDEQYLFTLKGPGTFERDEWEINIPKEIFNRL